MQDHEVTQWRRAFHLFRQSQSSEGFRELPIFDNDEESLGVQEKLRRLMHGATMTQQAEPGGPLDSLILRLGFGQHSDQDAETLDAAMIGRDIGEWTVVSRLGHGGMSAVFLVERRGVEFQQQGALKLLSMLMLATGGSERFIREQQFLAKLQHPNIAMLLDGGVAEDGTPYLVTELVEGIDIATYCQQQNLDARQIVRLLIQVCSAVSHAHAKLILHRDIKPSNVLVGVDARPKLLDFGIGKLAEEAEEGTITRVFTPRYAAPEQVQGQAVTTATDVFGLGMLAKTLLGEQVKAKRELNLVIEKAMHSDIDRRYRSVESLSADFKNWLDSRPISAVPDSFGYRMRKFIGRNKAVVAAGFSIILITVIGITAVMWQANVARDEATRAQALADFMIDLFQDGDLFSGEGPLTPISDLMRKGAERAREELGAAPAAKSEVLRVIGLAQTEFGEYEQAGANLETALAGATEPLERARILGSMGVWAAEQAEFAQGIEWMQQSLAIMSEYIPITHPDRLEVEINLINFLLFTGERQQSMDRADALVAGVGNLNMLQAVDHANVLRSRAMALIQLSHFDEAIASLNEAIAIAQNLKPPRPALVAAFYNDLGIAYNYQGDQAGAADSLSKSYSTQVSIYGASHKRTLTSGSNLVLVLRAAGQLENARELGGKVVQISQGTYGDVHRSTVIARLAFALVLSDSGDHASADEQLMASVAALRQLDDLRSELPNHLAWRAEILIRLGQFDAAIPLLNEAETIRDQEFPDEPRRYRVASQRRLVQAHAALGQCNFANNYLNAIHEDLESGSSAELISARIYMLNCESDLVAKEKSFSNLQESALTLQSPHAGLQAAILWGENQFRH